MSTLSIWIIGITLYLVGVAMGYGSNKDNDLAAGTGLLVAACVILLLVLVGVKIGGAA